MVSKLRTAERIVDFVVRDTRPREELDALSQEIAGADIPTLADTARVLNTVKTERLTNTEHDKLLGTHIVRVAHLARSGEAGVYGLPRHHLVESAYRTLTRETRGLFLGALPETSTLQAQVDATLARARANAHGEVPLALERDKFTSIATHLLGINRGSDQISEATIRQTDELLELDAFDRAGFHVLYGVLAPHGDALEIGLLKATHGRNVEDLESYNHSEAKMPGRGNARAISESLSAATEAALNNGFSALACTPGSDEVAVLYAKMGFKRVDGGAEPQAYQEMRLDLADRSAVQQMVFVFAASRAGVTDVPKNVAEKALAAHRVVPPPARTLSIIDFKNSRNFMLAPDDVLTLK